MDDETLVVAVAAGDDAALRELFGRHAPWLAARLRSVLAAADVEDVVQETFIGVWRGTGPRARSVTGSLGSPDDRPRCCCAGVGRFPARGVGHRGAAG
jgi:hypothetical protein